MTTIELPRRNSVVEGESASLAIVPPLQQGAGGRRFSALSCRILDEDLALITHVVADGRPQQVRAGRIVVSIVRPSAPSLRKVVELEPGGRYVLRFKAQPRRTTPRDLAPDIGYYVRYRRQIAYGKHVDVAAASRLTGPGVMVADVLTDKGEQLSISLPPQLMPVGDSPTLAPIKLDRDRARAVLTGDETLQAVVYLEAGQLRDARTLVEPRLDRLMRIGIGDPVEAAIVGYVLLKTGEFDMMAPWCLDLPAAHPWLPDGFVIAAEWFADAGYHLTALNYLRQLERSGLPLFTRGFSRAVSRLDYYRTGIEDTLPSRRPAWIEGVEAREQPSSQFLYEWDRDAADHLFRHLARRLPSIDLSAPTLTIRAEDRERRQLGAPISLLRTRLRGLTAYDRHFVSRQAGPRPFSFLLKGASVMAAEEPGAQPSSRLTGAPLILAILAVALWGVFAIVLLFNSNTRNEVTWNRLAFVFASIEAVAFGAAGALWGVSIQRQRAEAAEQRAQANAEDASNGRALAATLKAEVSEVVQEDADASMESLGGAPGDEASRVLQRHARAAQALFPDV
jgi:hypothetical protein